MSRVQLALNVSDLDASIEFYTRLFQVVPHKLRPGYANFEVAEPPLKLVLIQAPAEARGTGVSGALNHLGVEVEDTATVMSALDRMRAEGVETTAEMDTNCCYAQQDKVWVHDPAGTPWEIYTITDNAPEEVAAKVELVGAMNDGACCIPTNADLATARAVEMSEIGEIDRPDGGKVGCC